MNPTRLPIWTACHIALMIVLAYIFGLRFTPFTSYVSTIAIYWCICWLFILLFSPRSVSDGKTRETNPLLNCLPFVPVAGIAYVAFSKPIEPPAPLFITAIVGVSLINGFTEEMYWRKLYVDNFCGDFLFGLLLPCLLFPLWHVALLAIPSIVYEGGGLALVGGAAILGVIWGVAYWFNRNFWVISFAHFCVNVIAFTMLASDNNWIAG